MLEAKTPMNEVDSHGQPTQSMCHCVNLLRMQPVDFEARECAYLRVLMPGSGRNGQTQQSIGMTHFHKRVPQTGHGGIDYSPQPMSHHWKRTWIAQVWLRCDPAAHPNVTVASLVLPVDAA